MAFTSHWDDAELNKADKSIRIPSALPQEMDGNARLARAAPEILQLADELIGWAEKNGIETNYGTITRLKEVIALVDAEG